MGAFRSLFVECLEQTSAKGIPRIIKHKTASLRAMWLIGVMVLSGLALYTLVRLLEQYFSFTTTTKSSEENLLDMDLPPPDVVICNMEPVSRTGLNNSQDIIQFSEYLDKVGNNSAFDSLFYNPNRLDHDHLWTHLSSYISYFQYIGVKNSIRVGHQSDPLIVDCRWLYATTASTRTSKKCDVNEIKRISTPQFFNCYRVPLLDMNKGKLGMPVGLSLMLYMDRPESEESEEEFHQEREILQNGGLRMTLSPPDTMPDLVYTAFDVQTWKATHVRLRVEKRVRSQEPFGECIHYNDSSSFFDLSGDKVWYTHGTCINACIQDLVTTECECIDPELLVVSSTKSLDQPYCGTYTEDIKLVAKRIECSDNIIRRSCPSYQECLPLCSEYRFHASLASSEWPKRTQLLSFYKNVIVPNKHKYSKELNVYEEISQLLEMRNISEAKQILYDAYFIEDNFAKVTFTVSLNYANVLTDVPKMTFDVFLSQVGGALNLYSGISLIVCVEILELFYKLIMYPFSERKITPDVQKRQLPKGPVTLLRITET